MTDKTNNTLMTAGKPPQPLYEVEGLFHADIVYKIGRFFEWLRGIEAILDAKGMDCNVQIDYAEPFTPGGPFVEVPTAIISAVCLYRGFAYKSEKSGKEPERRAIRVVLQNMMAWSIDDYERAASIVAHTLQWYSKAAENFFSTE